MEHEPSSMVSVPSPPPSPCSGQPRAEPGALCLLRIIAGAAGQAVLSLAFLAKPADNRQSLNKTPKRAFFPPSVFTGLIEGKQIFSLRFGLLPFLSHLNFKVARLELSHCRIHVFISWEISNQIFVSESTSGVLTGLCCRGGRLPGSGRHCPPARLREEVLCLHLPASLVQK